MVSAAICGGCYRCTRSPALALMLPGQISRGAGTLSAGANLPDVTPPPPTPLPVPGGRRAAGHENEAELVRGRSNRHGFIGVAAHARPKRRKSGVLLKTSCRHHPPLPSNLSSPLSVPCGQLFFLAVHTFFLVLPYSPPSRSCQCPPSMLQSPAGGRRFPKQRAGRTTGCLCAASVRRGGSGSKERIFYYLWWVQHVMFWSSQWGSCIGDFVANE